MTRAKPGLRAELVTRDTFLERVAEGLERRVTALQAALADAALTEPARVALVELAGFSRELGLIARPDAVVAASPDDAVELGAAIRAVIDAHGNERTLGRRELRLSLDQAVHVACAHADVELVLVELLSNAAKYGKGAIGVRVDVTPPHARLTICDDGPGIAPAKRSRALARFGRGEGARPRTGYGVGLWLVRKVARGYGGDLKLRSNAVFEVTLPIAAGPNSGVADAVARPIDR